MCHESTSVALAESIGIGKASVSIEDVYSAKLIILAGQNPGTNHPRMLSALEIAKRNGAKIDLDQPAAGGRAGQLPRTRRRLAGVVGHGTELADLHLPIKINGDLALFQAFGSLLVQWGALDHDFISGTRAASTRGETHVSAIDWDVVTEVTGLSREQITEAAAAAARLRRDGVLLGDGPDPAPQRGGHHQGGLQPGALAQGNIGKPGAGLFPVRGHSNVQGDRTMGIWERPPEHFLDALQAEFGFDPPREHGLDTVDSIRALRDGKAHVFIGLGGNFVQAAPGHRGGRRGACAGPADRADLDQDEPVAPGLRRDRADPADQGPDREGHPGQRARRWISVEDSTCSVHASRGPLEPASPLLRSEVEIVAGLAEATLGDRYGIDWQGMRDDYSVIRTPHLPGRAGLRDLRGQRAPAGRLRHAASAAGLPDLRDRVRPGRVRRLTQSRRCEVPPGHLVLQTLRSHDQYNTTIYGLSDRYRGIEGGRRVDLRESRGHRASLGFADGDLVDIVTHWTEDDHERPGAGIPDRRVPDAARLRCRVLPGDQPTGAAGLDRAGKQHSDLEVDHRRLGPAGHDP